MWLIKKEKSTEFVFLFTLLSLLFNGIYLQGILYRFFDNIFIDFYISFKYAPIVFNLIFIILSLSIPSIILYYYTKLHKEWILGGIIGFVIFELLNYLLNINISITLPVLLFQGLLLYKKTKNYYFIFTGVVFGSIAFLYDNVVLKHIKEFLDKLNIIYFISLDDVILSLLIFFTFSIIFIITRVPPTTVNTNK